MAHGGGSPGWAEGTRVLPSRVGPSAGSRHGGGFTGPWAEQAGLRRGRGRQRLGGA